MRCKRKRGQQGPAHLWMLDRLANLTLEWSDARVRKLRLGIASHHASSDFCRPARPESRCSKGMDERQLDSYGIVGDVCVWINTAWLCVEGPESVVAERAA